MAYKRKYASGMGSTRRKLFKSNKTAVPKRQLSAAVKKAVYGMAEKKRSLVHIDEQPLGSISQGSWYTPLCTPSNNTANVVNRVGQEITLSRMHFKGSLHNNGNTNNIVRILIGYYKDTQAFTTTSQIFENPNGFGTAVGFSTVNNLDSTYWPVNPVKFTTVLDRTYLLAPVGSVDASNVKVLEYKINLKNAKIKFEGTDAGQDGQDKNLTMIAWTGEAGDDATIGTNVELSGLSRVFFTDL